jgi:hypothetical protein
MGVTVKQLKQIARDLTLEHYRATTGYSKGEISADALRVSADAMKRAVARLIVEQESSQVRTR